MNCIRIYNCPLKNLKQYEDDIPVLEIPLEEELHDSIYITANGFIVPEGVFIRGLWEFGAYSFVFIKDDIPLEAGRIGRENCELDVSSPSWTEHDLIGVRIKYTPTPEDEKNFLKKTLRSLFKSVNELKEE